MRAAATLLASCLLALTSQATRLQWLKPLSDDQYDETSTESEQAKLLCEYFPQIQVKSVQIYCTIYDSGFKNGPNKVSVAHGTEVNVDCRGTDAAELTFSRNGKIIIPAEQSDYTISLKQKLDLQPSQYTFKCTDIDGTCERSVNIFVTPRFEVISPNAKTCFDYGNCSPSYYVQYGNSVSVLCSGAAATRLVMTKNGKTLPTERMNGTTIESSEMRPDLQISEYACNDVDTTLSTSMNIKVVPNIYFQSQNETITPYNVHADCNRPTLFQEYYFQYSGSIDIFCSGPRAVKFVDPISENEILPSKNFNETTIFRNISKSGISEDITCADSEFTDYVQQVKVIVLNRMEVVSPSARLVGSENGVTLYTIPYGQPLEIVCSGADASRLTISVLWGDTSITDSVVQQAVNKSAIKYIINNSSWDNFMPLICADPERYEGDLEQSQIQVAVLPSVTNFRCVSYNVQFVNCTWTRISNSANNTLYYVSDGILTQICVLPRTSRLYKFCTWEYEYDYGFKQATVLTFIIQSCSYDACYNQTFQFDHLSIVKLAPPEKLKVLRKTSRGAVLGWSFRLADNADYNILTDYFGGVDQRVQYWYPGIDPRDDNSSLVTCEYDAYAYCEIELNLPCPGQLYEVRISHKLNIASEDFMSAPTSVTFYTDKESDNATNNDPTCSQEPLHTKEVMSYIVQELRKEMLPEMQPMKRAVRALQDKLANVRKYIGSIKEKDEK